MHQTNCKFGNIQTTTRNFKIRFNNKNRFIKKILLTLLLIPTLLISQDGCWNNVYSGRVNSYFINTDGSTWVTGNNDYGQLGLNSDTSTLDLVNLEIPGFIKFAVGDYHILGIKSDGTLWGWGKNDFGQLGDGTLENKSIPVQIGEDNDWFDIATGRRHSTAIKNDGTLWAWGYNEDGSIGVGNTEEYLSPVQIGTDTNWSKISMGYYHSIGIKSDGTLWTWGWNELGALGDGTTTNKMSPVQIGSEQQWLESKGGNGHTVAIKTDGTLWAWGWNILGQLGDGTVINRTIPTQIGNENNWKSISAGLAHTLVLNTSGEVFSCGLNMSGQLGLGVTDDTPDPNPTLLQVPISNYIDKVSCGSHVSHLIDSNNNILSFGTNEHGQFGNGNNISNASPINYIDCATLVTNNEYYNTDNFTLYPNPANNFVIIRSNELSMNKFKYKIYDSHGKFVGSGLSVSQEPISIEGFTDGNYFIQIESSNGLKFTYSFIKK